MRQNQNSLSKTINIVLNVSAVSIGITAILSIIIIVNMNYAYSCPSGGCDGFPPQTNNNPTPLKQLLSGIKPIEVKCNIGFQLVIQSDNQFPACVKPSTAKKLVERGWGEIYYPSYAGTASNQNSTTG